MNTWLVNGQSMMDNYAYYGRGAGDTVVLQREVAQTNAVMLNTAWNQTSWNLMHAANYQDAAVYVVAAAPCNNSVNNALLAQGQQADWDEHASLQDEAWWHESSYLSSSTQRRRRRQRAKHAQMAPEDRDCVYEDENRMGESTTTAELAQRGKDLRQRFQKAHPDSADVRATIAETLGNVLGLAFDKNGCYAVQSALDLAERSVQTLLAYEMRGHVKRAIASPHANHVVAKIVEVLPPSQSNFIVVELRGDGAKAARHPFGCRVINRLVEHSLADRSSEGDLKAALIDEIVLEAGDLCRHQFGHHVMNIMLEHGLPEHRSKIVAALMQDLHVNARNRRATYVIEQALMWASAQDVKVLEQRLTESSENIMDLADNQFGHHVVKTLMKQTAPQLGDRGSGQQFTDVAQFVQKVVRENADELKKSKFGVRLVEELE